MKKRRKKLLNSQINNGTGGGTSRHPGTGCLGTCTYNQMHNWGIGHTTFTLNCYRPHNASHCQCPNVWGSLIEDNCGEFVNPNDPDPETDWGSVNPYTPPQIPDPPHINCPPGQMWDGTSCVSAFNQGNTTSGCQALPSQFACQASNLNCEWCSTSMGWPEPSSGYCTTAGNCGGTGGGINMTSCYCVNPDVSSQVSCTCSNGQTYNIHMPYTCDGGYTDPSQPCATHCQAHCQSLGGRRRTGRATSPPHKKCPPGQVWSNGQCVNALVGTSRQYCEDMGLPCASGGFGYTGEEGDNYYYHAYNLCCNQDSDCPGPLHEEAWANYEPGDNAVYWNYCRLTPYYYGENNYPGLGFQGCCAKKRWVDPETRRGSARKLRTRRYR